MQEVFFGKVLHDEASDSCLVRANTMPAPHIQHVESKSRQHLAQRSRSEVPQVVAGIIIGANIVPADVQLLQRELHARRERVDVRKGQEKDAVLVEHSMDCLKIGRRIFEVFKDMVHNHGVELSLMPAEMYEITIRDFCAQL